MKVEDHFTQLDWATTYYYLGYARQPAEIACPDVEEGYHSVTTCAMIPGALWKTGAPSYTWHGDEEPCTESIQQMGANDIKCTFGRINRIVCQFSRECPANYEKVEGIYDKCFLVESNDGFKDAKQAKRYCTDRYVNFP